MVIADYTAIPADAFAGVATVVNCVGTPVGDAVTMTRINVDVPLAAATAARAAGCRRFIQLSSLSVYGRATAIGVETPVAPVSAYGRSKADADAALLGLAAPGFGVTILRVPALYGNGAMGKLGTLARAMQRYGGFVAPPVVAPRSLLHLDNAVAVIKRLISEPHDGVVLAADHAPFELSAFAGAVAAASGSAVRLVRAPAWFATGLRWLAPNLYASIFAPSLIDPAAAITTGMPLPVAMADGIAAMLAAEPLTR